MENESEKLDHQVAGLPSLCLASSRILFSVHTAERAIGTALEEVGGAAFRADIAGMRHETQHTRLFRS
jgi:urease accessory protein UreF